VRPSLRAGSILLLALASAASGETTTERAAALNQKGVRLAEAGRYVDAIEAFDAALEAAPKDETIRSNLGRCQSNFGVQLLERGELAAAEKSIRRALEFLPDDPVTHLNLAACLDERGWPARAAAEVREGLRVGPGLASTHDQMATILLREGDLEGAASEWEKAAKLAPQDAAIAQRLAKANASILVENRLARQRSAHFEIRYDLERDAVLASNVLAAMETVHGEVGADLQRSGQEKLVVVLLPTDQFVTLTGAHKWVSGLYDGRIRLPVKDSGGHEADLLARARHEYVHSVLAPLGRRAPGWLHEGLAQVYEGRSVAQARRRLAERDPPAYAALRESFASTRSTASATALYDTSLAFVAWLREGTRGAAFRAAMASLFADAALDEAFESAYGKPLAELYAAFLGSLRS
jgi:Flp pilus assembly protein TadD